MNEEKYKEIIGQLYVQLYNMTDKMQELQQHIVQANKRAEQAENLLKQNKEQQAQLQGLLDSANKNHAAKVKKAAVKEREEKVEQQEPTGV